MWPRVHIEGVRELASTFHGARIYGRKGPSFPVGETIIEASGDFSVSEQVLLTIGKVVNSGQTATTPTLSRGQAVQINAMACLDISNVANIKTQYAKIGI